MGCHSPFVAACKVRRPPAHDLLARSGQRHLLCRPRWLRLADAAEGLSSLPDGLRLLSRMAQGRYVGKDPPHATRPSASEGRSRRQSECSHSRQSERQDDRKRGPRGYDAGKKVKGRKRHILVDTLGLVLGVTVHPADIQDRDGAKLVLEKLGSRFPRLQKIWADAAYSGKLVDWAKEFGNWVLEIVKRSDTAKGFEL